MAKTKKSAPKKTKKTKQSTKKKNVKLIPNSGKEMLQPGGRGGMITPSGGFPGYRGV